MTEEALMQSTLRADAASVEPGPELDLGTANSRAAASRRADVPRHSGVAMGVVVALDLTLVRRAIGRSERAIDLDPDGLPVFAGGQTWPLELED